MSQLHTRSFPKFGHLPTEIQDLIWELALESPPAAHFADLDMVSLPEPMGTVGTPRGTGKRSKVVSEVLIKLGSHPEPITLGHSYIAPHALLLQTCRASRRAAFRCVNAWEPGRSLQLYAAENSTLRDAFNLIESKRRSAEGDEGGTNNNQGHGEYPSLETIDVPCHWVDSNRDLVVIPKGWERQAQQVRAHIRMYKSMVPIQRPRYLGLGWSYNRRSLNLFLFARFRCDVLYVILDPDELNEPPEGNGMTPELVREQIQKLERRFERQGVPTEDLAADIPENFWRGKREFYVLSWKEVEQRMMDSYCQDLRDITAEILEIREMEDDVCNGCDYRGCDLKPDMFPIAWRIMSWRDLEE